MITEHQALTADRFEHVSARNADNTPMRARRSGATRVWKTRPGEFKIPVKHGLRNSGYITNENAAHWYVA